MVLDRIPMNWLYSVMLLSLTGAYLLAAPFMVPDTGLRFSSDLKVHLEPVESLPHSLGSAYLLRGNFTGHAWPGNIPESEPVHIYLAVDNPRIFIVETCSHELEHWRLEKEGVPTAQHHAVMEKNFLLPWHWDARCLQLLPKIPF